jgi:Siphovirus Gp157
LRTTVLLAGGQPPVSDNLFKARQEHRAIVQRIREMYPDEDDATLADSIEGESTLEEAIMATLRAANENDASIEGLKAYIDRLEERVTVLKERTERLRQAALQAALEAGVKTPLRADDFSAGISQGRRKVVITGDVPDSFRLPPKPREPDRKAIGDALNAGVKLPFAELGNPTPFWTIRTR